MNTDFARRQMVEQQIRTSDVTDPLLLNTFGRLARHEFVPAEFRALAYAETEIPLPHGENMLRPSIEGLLLQALEIEAEDEALVVGTGSGYLTACIAGLARQVLSVDIHQDFIDAAGKRLATCDIHNVELQQHDVARNGLPGGRYDAIAITASVATLDTQLFEHLKPGGRLFVVVGDAPVMEALLVEAGSDGEPRITSLFETCLRRMRHDSEPPRFAF